MKDHIVSFVRKLQESPEHVRRNWLIGLSSGSALIVIAFWVSYLNTIVKPTSPVAIMDEKPGVAATFGKGVEIVFGEAKKGGGRLTGSVKEILGGSNELSIQ